MRSLVLVGLLAVACGPPEAVVDSGPPVDDVVFEAVPNPDEQSDCPSAAPAAGEARAKHIVCVGELLDGALAMGRVGDVVVENAVARFVVRTGDEGAVILGAPPGGIVDGASVGGVDGIKEILPLFEFESLRTLSVTVVDAGGDEARVRVLFESAPLEFVSTVVPALGRPANARGQLDYVLRPGERVLRIELTITSAIGVDGGTSRPGVFAMLGGAEEVVPGYGLLTSDMPGGPGTSVVAERSDGALALDIASDSGTLLHVDTIHILQGARVSYERGATTRFDARLAVGANAAEAWAPLTAPGLGVLEISGAAGDRVEIARDGRVVLRSRLDGPARIPLPAATYDVRPGFDTFFETTAAPVVHATATTYVVPPAPSALLEVAATLTGDPGAPVRVTVERGTDEIARFIGPGSWRLPAGPARVTVSHGLEYDAFAMDVVLSDGVTTTLSPVLDRVLDTTGWVGVDLHLHSEISTDSTHRLEEALRMIAAEGLDAVSSTDHDFVTDYAAIEPRVGLGDRVLFVRGEEVSTTIYGHINGYPLLADPARSGAGAVQWFDLSPSEVFDALRDAGDPAAGGALVQVNHPRLRGTSFFDRVGLDDATGHATGDPMDLGLPPTTDLDDFSFDVIEVWNGYTRGDNERSFEDYLALFAAGRRFAMVGNSDTHRPTLPAGSPRSFVRVPSDARGGFDWSDVATSLRARDVTVAAGVLVTATIAGPRAAGVVPVHVVVQAPPWVGTDRLRIYAGRTATIDRTLGASSAPVRLDETIDVPIAATDGFVVVRVDGAVAPEPMQHFEPYGITNALLVP